MRALARPPKAVGGRGESVTPALEVEPEILARLELALPLLRERSDLRLGAVLAVFAVGYGKIRLGHLERSRFVCASANAATIEIFLSTRLPMAARGSAGWRVSP